MVDKSGVVRVKIEGDNENEGHREEVHNPYTDNTTVSKKIMGLVGGCRPA